MVNIEEGYIERINRLINKITIKAKAFCDKYCCADAFINILNSVEQGVMPSEEILYNCNIANDYDYYAFAKSTKSLCAIKSLLRDKDYNFNEDILIITRSIFETHIMSRYFREKINNKDIDRTKIIRDFIKNPLMVAKEYYSLQGFRIIDSKGDCIGKQIKPSNYKIGYDDEYYRAFYYYLSEIAHGSFSRVDNYFDRGLFIYDKNIGRLETSLFVIFVFTKILEGVTTVKDESYGTLKEEKTYYDLVYDSIELQYEVFEYLIDKYQKNTKEQMDIGMLYSEEGSVDIPKNKTLVKMLSSMRESIFEELGSLKKDAYIERVKFIRKY